MNLSGQEINVLLPEHLIGLGLTPPQPERTAGADSAEGASFT